jgi:PAS domain S-box-containing protein
MQPRPDPSRPERDSCTVGPGASSTGAGPDLLLVEDDPSHALIIRRAFENAPGSGQLRIAGTLAEARKRLETFTPDLAIVDLNLPDGKGTDLLETDEPPYPVVIMTSHGGEQIAVEVMKSGALDYVVKDGATLSDMPHIAARALREWSHIDAGRRAEAALRQSEARYRALTEHAYDLVAEVDDRGILLFVSPNHREQLGLDPAELVGTDGTARVHPADRSALIANVERILERGVVVQESYRYMRGNGTWCWLESSARSYRTARGELRAVVSSRDVSDRRELEEQLRQAQKLEAVGQLAGGIAHDFNNLLTVISGYGEYLVGALEADGEEHEAAQQICGAAERSASLTRQLLAFSRSQVLQPRTLDLNDVITDLGKMLWRLIGEDIQLTVDLDPGIGQVQADRGQIEQIIVNLAVNARDAMENGGLLNISTARAGDGLIRLSVIDSGHGMDEPTRQRIFEPFFTTKQVGQGTGLGLSTVYGIVSQSGGTISVQSEPGRGARFDIDLPVASSETAAAGHTGGLAKADRQVEGGEMILLVEDEPKVRALLYDSLEKQGYRVVAAADGGEALDAVTHLERPVDLLLTDIVMPGIDGVELAHQIRRSRSDLRVLFMSGYSERHARRPRPTLPADAALIQKPFRLSDLTTAVRHALDGT